ncbi:insulin gene enhancer protein isl-1 isoform X2 [Gambusia affinis]|uniref:insulin gene enhancer protein isl-1 isoform X2 n=1 Tax=Gambusia affinis TaxID=33528 RepID=UPI001CDD5017|nr:insulin gene enhancer protein isl-1 isoform X2 [Gambusia affinis]
MQSQSATHAYDVLMSYVSSAACQDQSSTHTHTHAHTRTGGNHTHTSSLRLDTNAPGPATEHKSRLPGAAARCESGLFIAFLFRYGRHGGSSEKLYGIKCAKCNIGFSKNDFVMRARSKVYHIECFRCVACSRQLIPGDEFALREDGLFCRADHDVVERANLGSGDPLSPLHPARPLQMAEPISARQPALRPHVHKQPEKTTRVRTVLNEKQLHTLRTCYNANPRPDALMKEQLVEMTGLSPRVIRVWFQNKRCKDKKKSLLMKQLQQQQPNDKTNIQGMTGTPMVAASPERHDGGIQANPVEVQSYQPPWKVLSDFALQSDIDQPAFQQLVSFSEGGPGSNSTGSEVASMSSQLPDTPNSMVSSPIEA